MNSLVAFLQSESIRLAEAGEHKRCDRMIELEHNLVSLIEHALTCVVHAEDLRDGTRCRNEQETARVAIDVRNLRSALARIQGDTK